MKTLYINIGGENIQSTNDVIVIGKPENALINKFHFELGNEIKRRVYAPDVNQTELIKGFISQHKKIYEEKILPQLEKAKSLMLSQDLRGNYSIQLPQEYIEWLNYNGESVYSEIAKSLKEKDCIVEINLARIYRNGIMLLVNNIDPGNYDQLVVNDNVVEDDTEMIVAIRNKVNNPILPFIPFDEYEKKDDNVCPKCGKKPCECKPEAPVCPKCGKNPCECEKVKMVSHDILFVTIYIDKKEKYDDWKYYETEIFDINFKSLLKVKARIYEHKRINNHDILILEEDNERSFVRITVDSIEQSLTRDEIENKSDDFSSDDVRKLEYFSPQYKGGLDYIGKSGDEYLLYGYKDNLKDRNSADVITSKGNILFTLKKEDKIVVNSVLPSGLLLMEKHEDDNIYYGIIDRLGKKLLSCEHRSGHVFEKCPGVIKFYYENYYINAYTKEQYVDVEGKYALKKILGEDNSLVDIVCITDGTIIKKDVVIDDAPKLTRLGNGWYSVDFLERNKNSLVDKVSMLFCENKQFILDREETVLRMGDERFISNNRIVTIVNHGNGIVPNSECEDVSEIRIRDYDGNIIKTIENPRLFLPTPYKKGKLTAFTISNDGIARPLTYFDMKGDKHIIPYEMNFFHYSNLWARFISETTLIITNAKRRSSTLIDINGKVLLNSKNMFVVE